MIIHNRSPFSQRRTLKDSAMQLGLRDVSQPLASSSHSWAELISQIIDLFSKCGVFVHPNVASKTLTFQ
jgi:hypothetical protein